MKNCHVIENNYLCGDNIKFAMITDKVSDKLKGVLVKKYHLINEAQVIERIENAVLAYYNLSLIDIDIEEDVNYNCYVYIYATPLEKGRWHIYGNEYIDHKPLYIGKGQDDRYECHLQYSHNSELDIAIKSLAELGVAPIIKLYNKGCTTAMAHNLENYIIARLREQGVDLCNATTQSNSEQYRKNKEILITSFSLEKAEHQLILDALNSTRNRREAASVLGISERTLYRKIKGLDIIGRKGVFYFDDKRAESANGMKVDSPMETKTKNK